MSCFVAMLLRKLQTSATQLNPQGKSRCEVVSKFAIEVKEVPKRSPCSYTVLHSQALPLLFFAGPQ